MADCVRDEIVEQLQLHGRQPAKKIAEALSAFDGVAAPDGVDAEMDDDACAGGACKI